MGALLWTTLRCGEVDPRGGAGNDLGRFDRTTPLTTSESGPVGASRSPVLNEKTATPEQFHAASHSSSWDLMLEQRCGGSLAIDDRAKLWERLQTDVPIAYFAAGPLQVEIELFILQSVRARLGLETHDRTRVPHHRHSRHRVGSTSDKCLTRSRPM